MLASNSWRTHPTFKSQKRRWRVVAKRVDRPSVAGRGRDWVKVKRQRTIDCAVVGITGDLSAPRLALGLESGVLCIAADLHRGRSLFGNAGTRLRLKSD
jgi:hypothetical protein